MAKSAEFPREEYIAIPPGYYDAVYRRGRGVQWFWHRHRFAMVESRLPRELGRLLDLGCGPGTFLGRLPMPFGSALGLDLAGPQIEYARRTYARPGLEFREQDVRELGVAEAYDAVVSIEVVEHLPPDSMPAFLRTIFELLSPGGRFVLTTPNLRSPWPLVEQAVSIVGPVDYRLQHINLLTMKRLAAALVEAGFESVDVSTFFVVSPFLAGLSNRLARRLLGWERTLLPAFGCELVARADKPR